MGSLMGQTCVLQTRREDSISSGSTTSVRQAFSDEYKRLSDEHLSLIRMFYGEEITQKEYDQRVAIVLEERRVLNLQYIDRLWENSLKYPNLEKRRTLNLQYIDRLNRKMSLKPLNKPIKHDWHKEGF